VEAAFAGALEGFLHDVNREALDLDVHLDRGNTVAGPCDLEVHVTQGSSDPRMSVSTATLSPSFTRPIATPAHGAFIGTPASMSASDPEHTVAIEDDPFDSSTSDTTRSV
jgi:hypothetical protein